MSIATHFKKGLPLPDNWYEGDGVKTHTLRYGNSSISWQRVLAPSIKMAKEGIPVSKTLADAISDKNWFGQKKISWVLFQCQRLDPTLKEIFTDPSTGEAWKENTNHRRPLLAATLEALAKVTALNEEKNDTWSSKPYLVSDIEKEMSPWIWITTCLDKKLRCSLLTVQISTTRQKMKETPCSIEAIWGNL